MLGLMEAFKAGHLPLQEGTTLRSFLSRMMKCKPKRISKKFEGISYNGRLTYQKSKQPMTMEQAVALRARLSELERRYLASAAAQEGNSSSEGAVNVGAQLVEYPSFSRKMPSSAAAQALGDGLMTDRRNSGLAGSLGFGLGSQDQGFDISRFNQQSRNELDMAEALLRNRESSLVNQSGFNSSLLGGGFAQGDNFRNMNQAHLLGSSQFTGSNQLPPGLSMQGNDPTSAFAMQLRERSWANSLAQLSRNSAGGLQIPQTTGTDHGDPGGLAQHNMDLNRYVLQSPQDDNTYFQQRLLPSVNAGGNASAVAAGFGGGYGMGITTAARAPPGTMEGGTGSVADYLKRHLQMGKEDLSERPVKRQR